MSREPGADDRPTPPARWRRTVRIPIKTKIGLLVGLVAALAVVLPTLVYTVWQVRVVRERAVTQATATAELVSRQVQMRLVQTDQELHMLAADPSLAAAIQAGDAEAVSRRLELIAAQDPDLSGLTVFLTDGRIWAVSLPDRAGIGVSYATQRHIRAAIDAGRSTIGDARLGIATRRPLLPIGVPIRDPGGRVIGVLQGGLLLDRLTQQLGKVSVGDGGFVTLLDHRGMILAHRDPLLLLNSSDWSWDDISRSLSEALRDGLPSTTLETTNYLGDPVLAGVAPVPHTDWVAEVLIPLEEIYRPLRETLQAAAAAALIAFALATLVGLLAARIIVGPLVLLHNTTRRISGQADAWLPAGLHEAAASLDRRGVRSGDEFEELAADFATMTRRLGGVLADLADRIATEERTRIRAENDRALATAVLDSVGEGIVFVNADGQVALVNSRLSEALPAGSPDPGGRPFSDLFATLTPRGEDPATTLGRIGLADGNGAEVAAAIVPLAFPHPAEVAVFTAPVYGRHATTLGRIYVLRDVTRERALDRLKNEFVSNVSHELRTPLTAIKGYIDLVSAGLAGELTNEQREFLGIAQRHTERLVLLINDLLDVARIESGRVVDDFERLDVVPILRDTATLLTPAIAARQQQLELDLPPGLPPVMGDANRLAQIVTNLLSNAHKYTPDGGAIGLSARAAGDRIEIRVSDTGIGLSDEDQSRLFEKFFRSGHRLVQASRGTGLGLVIVRALLEPHGGTINVSSRLGEGSVFTVTLPIAQSVAPAAPALAIAD